MRLMKKWEVEPKKVRRLRRKMGHKEAKARIISENPKKARKGN